MAGRRRALPRVDRGGAIATSARPGQPAGLDARPRDRSAARVSTATYTPPVPMAVAPRVAFAMSGDPLDRAAFSGLPASLCAALAELGADVVPVDVELPARWQRLLVNVMTAGFVDVRRAFDGLRAGRSPRLLFRDFKPKLHA